MDAADGDVISFPVDELEVTNTLREEAIDDEDDDATDVSQSFFPPGAMRCLSHYDNLGTAIRVEGWLKHLTTYSYKSDHASNSLHKKRRLSKKARYFVLRGATLSYYSQPHDVKAKGTFVLTSGCSVSPVIFGPLGGQEYSVEDQHSPTLQDETNSNNLSSVGNKSKKKREQFHCIQISWPMNTKISKDEHMVAQAKAQVAAESENEALHQKQVHSQILDSEGTIAKRTKSPSSRSLLHRKIPSRAKSASNVNSSPKPSPFRKTIPPTSQRELRALTPLPIIDDKHKSVMPSASANDPVDDNSRPSLHHEVGLHKHYTQQLEKHAKDQQKSEEERQKIMKLLSREATHAKNKKRLIQGTKVAALSTAAVTAGVLTAGVGVAAGLFFVGLSAAAGGSGAVVASRVYDKVEEKYFHKEKQMAFHLILGLRTHEEAITWKQTIERVIQELLSAYEEDTDEYFDDQLSWRVWSNTARSSDSTAGSTTLAGLNPKECYLTNMNQALSNLMNGNSNNVNSNNTNFRLAPKWVPLQGGGIALWGIIGFGILRIYREERTHRSSPWLSANQSKTSYPAIPKFRSDIGLVGQPFPPLRASLVLETNSLDAFMCLMCSGKIIEETTRSLPVPNSGQIASFRIIETINDHMDVIHLVFRPLFLFPLWTTPRDFVLYRFWKYDDDKSYHIYLDSGYHKKCPDVAGYIRGEMHSVYTIVPLRHRKKRTTPKSSVNTVKEVCLLSLTVQVDPRGWVPSACSVPFIRKQGYGDAFAIMALNQIWDVKEALDSVRFVTVPTDNNLGLRANSSVRKTKRLLSRRLTAESLGKQNISKTQPMELKNTKYISSLEVSTSMDASEDDEPDVENYDFQYSGKEMLRQSSSTSLIVSSATGNAGESLLRTYGSHKMNCSENLESPTIFTHPTPTRSDWWAEPDANSFRVRGKSYITDNRKINAGPSLFQLIAADIIETDVPILSGMCLHPTERVQLALVREKNAKYIGLTYSDMPPFVFCVNISIPGPPNYHLVFYYSVADISSINGSDGSASSNLCNKFFFENDDIFRDNTFKLIPQIIEGNFMVRKAVGSTPVIMGNKIKQTYIKGERFFEIIIDTGSSSVAAGVMRICNGYAKMIVVDLAFLFEGIDESTLPERVLGCVRLKNVEFGKKLRYVENANG